MNSLGETMFNALLTRIGVAVHIKYAKLVADDRGATAVEYGLIVGLIAIALIGALGVASGALQDLFGRIADTLDGTAP
jgi:pilus assembly protein Flp/PilA